MQCRESELVVDLVAVGKYVVTAFLRDGTGRASANSTSHFSVIGPHDRYVDRASLSCFKTLHRYDCGH